MPLFVRTFPAKLKRVKRAKRIDDIFVRCQYCNFPVNTRTVQKSPSTVIEITVFHNLLIGSEPLCTESGEELLFPFVGYGRTGGCPFCGAEYTS